MKLFAVVGVVVMSAALTGPPVIVDVVWAIEIEYPPHNLESRAYWTDTAKSPCP